MHPSALFSPRLFLFLLLFFGLGPLVFAQQSVAGSDSEGLPKMPFKDYVALFPQLELPFTVGVDSTAPADFPLLPPDGRLRNYGLCYDYRAIGQLQLHPDCFYLIHYHWCDSLSPTPFYMMHVYSAAGDLLTTKMLATETFFGRSWSRFEADGKLMGYQKAKAKKVLQSHGYSFSKDAVGRLVYCSDGHCTMK